MFKFIVKDKFSGMEFNGEIEAANLEAAREEIIEIYEYELGTDASELEISIVEVR